MKKLKRTAELESRFQSFWDELKWLYLELYHGDTAALDGFVSMLERMYRDRSAQLKKLDRARVKNPGWYRSHDLLGMQMYVDAFAGTLQGVLEKLPYIQDCGVDYLHLMPLLESPKGRSDGGYAVADYRTVQPSLGTMEDLSELAAECHRLGISLCLDFVMNHTSEDHEWARRARSGEKEYQDRYFFYDNWDIPNEFEKTVPQVFPTTAPGNFTWLEDAGKVVMTFFHPYQWDLNYANPAVLTDMTEYMLNLCNHGVDVVRMDAIPYIWKQLGTNCRNLPQVHTLSRILRIACEIVCPGTLLLGEVVMEPVQVVPYFGSVDKPECHMLYNVTTMASTWHTVATKDVRLLKNQLDKVFSLPKDYTFLNYLRCHVDIGWGLDYDFLGALGMEEASHKRFLNDYLTGAWPGSPARGATYNDDPRLMDARLCGTTASLCGLEAARFEKDGEKTVWAERLHIMLHAYMLTLSGVPIIYSGDEVARENDYSYREDPLKAEDSRWIHRGSMDWEAAGLRNDPGTVEGRVFTALRTLENMRRDHRVFDGRADVWLPETFDIGVLGIGRFCQGEKLLAFFNFSEGIRTVPLDDPAVYEDMMTGKREKMEQVTLPSGGFVWLLRDYTEEAVVTGKEERDDRQI